MTQGQKPNWGQDVDFRMANKSAMDETSEERNQMAAQDAEAARMQSKMMPVMPRMPMDEEDEEENS